jgi:hypothetical protein
MIAGWLDSYTPSRLLPHVESKLQTARQGSESLLDWALRVRFIYGKAFSVVPPLRAIYEDDSHAVIVRKSAQVFISEWMLSVALWVADTGSGGRGRGNALYTFPADKQGEDFSRARIEPAIQESPYLSSRLQNPNNVGLKRLGRGMIYIRGAQKRRQMIAVDADCVLYDEVAEYETGIVDTMERRLASSLLGWQRAGSTPRFPADEAGQLWEQSTKRGYFVACHACGYKQMLSVMTHLNPDTADVQCIRCKSSMLEDRLSEGEWVADSPSGLWSGYQLISLYSPRADLRRMAIRMKAVLEGRATTSATQEFYNSDCGESYLPEGGHLNADAIDACRSAGWAMPGAAPAAIAGIDQGKFLHVTIYTLPGGVPHLAYCGTLRDFEQLDVLMARYNVYSAVIDALPETREATRFAERWSGRVWMAYYPRWPYAQRNILCRWPKDTDLVQYVVSINRTAALDAVIAQFSARRVVLPMYARELGGAVDASGVGEFYRHLAAPIRVMETEAETGQSISTYVQNGPDHYAHATLYALIAGLRPMPTMAQQVSLTEDILQTGDYNIDPRY